MAERMSLIREVAKYKAEKGLPSFDREREGALWTCSWKARERRLAG